jgi:O-antigen ligase
VRALLVCLVPLGALAALGGTYPSSTVPILVAAVVAFLISGARVGGGEVRVLDAALVALAAGVVVQLIPLPRSVIAVASPNLEPLRAALYLDSGPDLAPLSANAIVTRAGLATLVSALLVFWAGRHAFGRGGLRLAASAVAWAGFALVLVSFVQRTTAPRLLLWVWKPTDPEAQPFGPFVNPNHLATWLLMAASLTAGYLVSHTQALGLSHSSLRLRVRDWLSDGRGLVLTATLLAMLVGIAVTLSRAAILGAVAALAVGFGLSSVDRRGRTAGVVGVAAAVLLAIAVWSNAEALVRKFDAVTTLGRLAIWRETLPILRDFWLTGTGVGTYAPTMLQYQHSFREVHFNQAHSEYLQVAAEGGVLLGAPLAIALGAGVWLARRRLKEDRRAISWLRIGAAAGLTGAAVQGLFETGLRIPANGLLAALLAAIVLHRRQDP